MVFIWNWMTMKGWSGKKRDHLWISVHFHPHIFILVEFHLDIRNGSSNFRINFSIFKKWFLQIFAEGWNCKDKNVYIYYFILKADRPNFILKSNWPKSTFIHYFIQSASRMHLFLLSGSVFQQLKCAANSNSPFSKIK